MRHWCYFYFISAEWHLSTISQPRGRFVRQGLGTRSSSPFLLNYYFLDMIVVKKKKKTSSKEKNNLEDNYTTSQSFLRTDSLMMTIDRRKRGRVIYFFSLGSPRSRSTKQFKVKRKNHFIIFFFFCIRWFQKFAHDVKWFV